MKLSLKRLSLGLATLALSTGCLEPAAITSQTSQLSEEQAATLNGLSLEALPASATPVRFNFESKVQLVGYEVNASSVRRGGQVKVTWYWSASSPPPGDWKLFTHLLTADGHQIANFDRVGPLRSAGSVSQWNKSKIYVDEQVIDVPADLKTPFIHLGVGVWSGELRLDLLGGVNDTKNRAIAVRLPVAS